MPPDRSHRAPWATFTTAICTSATGSPVSNVAEMIDHSEASAQRVAMSPTSMRRARMRIVQKPDSTVVNLKEPRP